MKHRPVEDHRCQNTDCPLYGKFGNGNIIRPHMALTFGKEIRTPAMQAGLVSKKLSYRDLFTSREVLSLFVIIAVLVWCVKWTRKAEMNTLTTVA